MTDGCATSVFPRQGFAPTLDRKIPSPRSAKSPSRGRSEALSPGPQSPRTPRLQSASRLLEPDRGRRSALRRRSPQRCDAASRCWKPPGIRVRPSARIGTRRARWRSAAPPKHGRLGVERRSAPPPPGRDGSVGSRVPRRPVLRAAPARALGEACGEPQSGSPGRLQSCETQPRTGLKTDPGSGRSEAATAPVWLGPRRNRCEAEPAPHAVLTERPAGRKLEQTARAAWSGANPHRPSRPRLADGSGSSTQGSLCHRAAYPGLQQLDPLLEFGHLRGQPFLAGWLTGTL